MNILLSLVVFTSNILGSFTDPFEFEGDYGNEVNPVREYVFEQVVAKESLAGSLTDSQVIQLMGSAYPSDEEVHQYRLELVKKAIEEDLLHGPTLKELVPEELIEELKKSAEALEGFCEKDLTGILGFLEKYRDQKVFAFLRHCPTDLLSLDKSLKDKASREGRHFDLPILSSTEKLNGKNAFELKVNLLHCLFTKETLSVVKPKEKLKEGLEKLDRDFLKVYLGQAADNRDLEIFTTPAGQAFFYWLYQALNLHLVAEHVQEINRVKQIFAESLGNANMRAESFRDKLVAADASVVFTQESDAIVPAVLKKEGLFHSVDMQNPGDGTFVFLRSDVWQDFYEIIPIEGYEGYEKGRLNVVLATKKGSGERFLLASCHGNSTRAEDGRFQVFKVVEKLHDLANLPENRGIQLIIGIDANTKSEEDVALLRALLESQGLAGTSVGPTTIKRRMVTAQHSKAGRYAIDEEDFVIVLKPEKGGHYQMTHPTVGFSDRLVDTTIALPNINNPSDHYPVGVTLLPSDD